MLQTGIQVHFLGPPMSCNLCAKAGAMCVPMAARRAIQRSNTYDEVQPVPNFRYGKRIREWAKNVASLAGGNSRITCSIALTMYV